VTTVDATDCRFAVSRLPNLLTSLHDSTRIWIVGEHGGLSRITGDIESSYLLDGMYVIHTEHGALYRDGDSEITLRFD
jgi:hypothetical protein